MDVTWKEQLKNKLTKSLYHKYADAFPHYYGDVNTVDTAKADIDYMEKISQDHPLELCFYSKTQNKNSELHLRFYQCDKPIPLSVTLPLLENLDLKAQSEQTFKIKPKDSCTICISDFIVEYHKEIPNLKAVTELFRDAFIKIYFGYAENDGFNKLVLSAHLTWQDIIILRAYAKYLQQIQFQFSSANIEQTLSQHPELSRQLVELFKSRHNPKLYQKKNNQSLIEKEIINGLDKVTSLNEDRIIRRYLDLIKATLRTNFFQKNDKSEPKAYLAIKLNSQAIKDLPLPYPLYEIFIYATDFEGIHLRNSKVARGGIRWSDRREDFRTEVLGLMKAQKVKNAVIVPSGAKGGFVLKNLNPKIKPEEVKLKVIQCYQSFIRGLLDLTDNIKNKNIISPRDVVCYDDPDPYLVVAADKGTATFSDTANAISKEYDFWLGDAFASGGKTGYDHKKMGITARGAWESVKRHFHELNIDCEKTDITVVGIGDMSGDVFGNGMIYSKHVKLLAAFDHRHIFIDPDPDAKISYFERLRLFNLPASSWQDYNPKLISKGGGVFSRQLKSISLTSQMKKILEIDNDSLTPNELISAILKAPVDLLFNGGIGTYVKSSQESHFDVGDRTNDFCRINGNELRCKVVGEGGNLGFTQLGRVEYALNNGLINTDFIDNSAGVDCSDHEVNLKILLNQLMRSKKLTETKRDQILKSLTKEVAELVLEDNYSQSLVISFSAYHRKKNMTLHINYINELESQGILKRKVEFLPDEKKLLERKSTGEGLTRPELAVLLAYSKIHIKQEILKSNLPEEPYFINLLETAFPYSIRKKYKSIMPNHDLHRDIIATQLANQIVNEMGITFIYRVNIETGAPIDAIVRAYVLASQIFESRNLAKSIDAFGFQFELSKQYDMLHNLRGLINLATRWFLHSHYLQNNLNDTISHFSTHVKTLEKDIPNLMTGLTKNYFNLITKEFSDLGLPLEMAKHIATYRAIYTTLNIIDVATQYRFDIKKTAQVYFSAGDRLNLVWFRDQIGQDSRDGHWNVLARLTLRDELDIVQRSLTLVIMKLNKNAKNTEQLIENWIQKNKNNLAHWEKMLTLIHASNNIDYVMFFIAVRELMAVINKSVF